VRFELYTDAALARDIPEHRLRRGDVVKIVDHHLSPNGENGYSIEVFNVVGDTIAITAVPESALESLRKGGSAERPSVNGRELKCSFDSTTASRAGERRKRRNSPE
jgi:hypothetical protein